MNNKLKLYVDQQQDDLKKNTVTQMTQNPYENKFMCVTCNQSIAKKNWLKKHIQEEHTKLL